MGVRVTMTAAGVAQIRVAAGKGTIRIANDMADDMRRYAPVDTGELVASIRVEPGTTVHRIWIGDVAAGVDYALYQEYGTSIMQAQPFIRPAVYQKRG